MYHSRSLNKKVNKLQTRCLRIIYNNKEPEVLVKNSSASIHHKNFQIDECHKK